MSQRQDIPVLYQDCYRRAKTSKASALKAMCQECVGYVRAEATQCTDEGCPLYSHRPYQISVVPQNGAAVVAGPANAEKMKCGAEDENAGPVMARMEKFRARLR